MELLIERTYGDNGTNGDLSVDGSPRCHTIELPWKNNQHGISCIPEGRYKLTKNQSAHLGRTLLINDVPERSECLVHAANNALLELRGCIAPVTTLTGEGTGDASRMVLDPLLDDTYAAIDGGDEVWLTIQSS